MPCSPYYTSQQIAKVLQSIVQNSTSVALTVLPDSSGIAQSLSVHSPISSYRAESDDDNLSDASNLTLRNEQVVVSHRGSVHGECDENSGHKILSLCLWKDFLYEDWGFSLADEESDGDTDEIAAHESSQEFNSWGRMEKKSAGAIVNEIRSGGSACLAGLKAGDKILKVLSTVHIRRISLNTFSDFNFCILDKWTRCSAVKEHNFGSNSRVIRRHTEVNNFKDSMNKIGPSWSQDSNPKALWEWFLKEASLL